MLGLIVTIVVAFGVEFLTDRFVAADPVFFVIVVVNVSVVDFPFDRAGFDLSGICLVDRESVGVDFAGFPFGDRQTVEWESDLSYQRILPMVGVDGIVEDDFGGLVDDLREHQQGVVVEANVGVGVVVGDVNRVLESQHCISQTLIIDLVFQIFFVVLPFTVGQSGRLATEEGLRFQPVDKNSFNLNEFILIEGMVFLVLPSKRRWSSLQTTLPHHIPIPPARGLTYTMRAPTPRRR